MNFDSTTNLFGCQATCPRGSLGLFKAIFVRKGDVDAPQARELVLDCSPASDSECNVLMISGDLEMPKESWELCSLEELTDVRDVAIGELTLRISSWSQSLRPNERAVSCLDKRVRSMVGLRNRLLQYGVVGGQTKFRLM